MALLVGSWCVAGYVWARDRMPPLPKVSSPPPARADAPPLVSIIVPARNERDCIERCVRSLLAQDFAPLEIIAIDDCSEDETGQILDRLAADDRRLRVIRGAPLPPGWMGKAHAIVQGYAVARGEWLLFTDADTEHAPRMLSGVMAHVRASQASFATVIGAQREPGRGVQLTNLAVFVCLSMVSNTGRLDQPLGRTRLVNGQYVIFARDAYERIGTHAALRHYSCTDTSMGYLVKLHGCSGLLLDARDSLDTTMYPTARKAFAGWSRNLVGAAWTVVGPGWGTTVLIAITAAMVALWIEPWVAAARGLAERQPATLAVGSLQILAGLTLMNGLIASWRSSWRPVSPESQPPLAERVSSVVKATLAMSASCLIFVAIVGAGLVRAWRRGGTVWKGRVAQTTRRLPAWHASAAGPAGSSSSDAQGARAGRGESPGG